VGFVAPRQPTRGRLSHGRLPFCFSSHPLELKHPLFHNAIGTERIPVIAVPHYDRPALTSLSVPRVLYVKRTVHHMIVGYTNFKNKYIRENSITIEVA
jgi:hypothetical protein